MRRDGWRKSFLRWAAAEPSTPKLLPGRPLDGAAGPAHEGGVPLQSKRAIACSGGGIRAAAFTLGGLQGLRTAPKGQDTPWIEDVSLITAVSGGSYMAGSYTLLNRSVEERRRANPGAVIPDPYAPGSPEDVRLRAHTRYLIEDPKVAATGILSIVYGLVLNLIPILAALFILAVPVGGLLHQSGVLVAVHGDWELELSGPVVWTGTIALAGLLLFALDRFLDVYLVPNPGRSNFLRTWALRVLSTALFVCLVFVAVPAVLAWASRLDGLGAGGADLSTQLVTVIAAITAIVGSVKGTLGKFKATLQAGGTPGGRVAALVRNLAPWLGSLICLALLTACFAAWVASAADTGPRPWPHWGMVLVCVVIMVVWRLVTDVNRNSVHPFYRERLSSAYFAVERDKTGTGIEPFSYRQRHHLSVLAGAGGRPAVMPELVVCATVNTDEEGVAPAGRRCAPFTFSPRWSGISSGTMFDGEPDGSPPEQTGPPVTHPTAPMVETRAYEAMAGGRVLTVPGVVAVSGAAVSPAMGRMNRAPLRLLLGLANVRLGLWLPNPTTVSTEEHAPATHVTPTTLWEQMRWQWRQPGIPALLRECLGRTSLRGRWVYVTDGGHYENLGLVEALRRGATEVVVFDASGDRPYSWSTFGRAVETARTDLGIEFELDPSSMKPARRTDTGVPTLVAVGTFSFPNGAVGHVYLCKLARPVKASWDVIAWANGHEEFPHDSTAQQLYGDEEFEAYRCLGELAAKEAIALMSPSSDDGPVGNDRAPLSPQGKAGAASATPHLGPTRRSRRGQVARSAPGSSRKRARTR